MQTICKVARRVNPWRVLSLWRPAAVLSTILSVSIVPARVRTCGHSRQIVGANLSLQIVRDAGNRKVRAVRVGVDTGGTFTDFVYETAGKLRVFKLPSTPDDPSRAIADGLKRISEDNSSRISPIEVVHGTTVGTNALLQRRGARTALVTTAGFEDVIEIGRQRSEER